MEILRVDNLTKIYGKGDAKVVALDNVSFTVNQGEFVAIVGASGSGKSTLLHLIGGVDRPTKGKVFIEGKDIYAMDDETLAIFRAMITHPAIILADEPTGNLDSKSSDEIVELLKLSNKKYKQTVIMITHNLEIAAAADRIIKIEDGHIVEED